MIKNLLFDKFGSSKVNGAHRSRLLWTGAFIKLAVGAVVASGFLTELFIPFVEYFVSSGFSDPYQYFVENGQGNEFPYPPLMLYILSLPFALLTPLIDLSQMPENAKIFLFRLVFLFFDLVLFFVLVRWLRESPKKVVRLFWWSPALFYISYVHGQLDIVPISLLFVSLYFLFKSRFAIAALSLGCALACKTNILLTLPFYGFFLVRRKSDLQTYVLFTSILVVSFFVWFLPFIGSSGLMAMVFRNGEQGKVFELTLDYSNELLLFFAPACYFLLTCKGATIRSYNRDILVMFLGFSFAILLLFVPPMPGWYFWILPFFIYFAIKSDRSSPTTLVFMLQIFYLAFFAFSPNADHFTLSLDGTPLMASLLAVSPSAVNITFTLLQSTLLASAFSIYRNGVQSYTQHKITSQPFLLGIAGDSGAGKTSLARALESIFRPRNTLIIGGDDTHRWERGDRNWTQLTHLNPKANNLHQELRPLTRLKEGRSILRRHYDHSTGKFTKETVISSKKLVLVEGLHAFYLKHIRDLFDLKVFIKPDRNLLHHWKIVRDVQERGQTKERVLKSIQDREADYEKFVAFQERFADVIVEVNPSEPQSLDVGNSDCHPQISYRLKLDNVFYLDPIVEALTHLKNLRISHQFEEDNTQSLTIEGSVSAVEIESIGYHLLPQLAEIGVNNPEWQPDLIGVLQLVFSYTILENSAND